MHHRSKFVCCNSSTDLITIIAQSITAPPQSFKACRGCRIPFTCGCCVFRGRDNNDSALKNGFYALVIVVHQQRSDSSVN